MAKIAANIRSQNSDIEMYRTLIASGQLPAGMPISARDIANYLRIDETISREILHSLCKDGFVTTDARMKMSIVDLSAVELESKLLELTLYETAAICRQSRLPEDELPVELKNLETDIGDYDALQIAAICQQVLNSLVEANLTEMSVNRYTSLVPIALTYRLSSMGAVAQFITIIEELLSAIKLQDGGGAMEIIRNYRSAFGKHAVQGAAAPGGPKAAPMQSTG